MSRKNKKLKFKKILRNSDFSFSKLFIQNVSSMYNNLKRVNMLVYQLQKHNI